MEGSMIRKAHLSAGVAMAMAAALAALGADPVRLNPAGMPRVAQVDERFQSYNVEMVEVTGGRFWAPYRTDAASEQKPGNPSPQGLDPSMFRMRPPLDLTNARLR